MRKIDFDKLNITHENSIKHFGEISKITKNTITISLESDVNCQTCNAKSSCGISGSNTKEIELKNNFQPLQINEKVNVIMQKGLGMKAVFFAYVLPFILMFITLIIASIFFQEWIAGLLSIFILIPYYIVIYLFKNSFDNYFDISIVKNN